MLCYAVGNISRPEEPKKLKNRRYYKIGNLFAWFLFFFVFFVFCFFFLSELSPPDVLGIVSPKLK